MNEEELHSKEICLVGVYELATTLLNYNVQFKDILTEVQVD